MRVVTMLQTKGGSGKTTLAMTLASAALAKGQRVMMYDGDVNKQLMGWRAAFEEADWSNVEKPAWPENLRIEEPPQDVQQLYSILEDLEEQGYDLVIIDTRPGSYEDTEEFALAADICLIPAKPAQAEWRLVLGTFEWMGELRKTVAETERFPAVRSVISNVSPQVIKAATGGNADRVPDRDLAVLNALMATAHLGTLVPTSRILEQYLYHGPLPIAEAAHRASRGGALMANMLDDMLGVAEALLDEIEEITGEAA